MSVSRIWGDRTSVYGQGDDSVDDEVANLFFEEKSGECQNSGSKTRNYVDL
jgi:hypothetical protein